MYNCTSFIKLAPGKAFTCLWAYSRFKMFQLPFNLNSNSSDEAGDDGDEEEEESESERGISYKTPSSRTPSSRFRPLGPLSTTTTPSSEFISPSLLQQVNRFVFLFVRLSVWLS